MTMAMASYRCKRFMLSTRADQADGHVGQCFAIVKYALDVGHTIAQALSLGRQGLRESGRQSRLVEEARAKELVTYEEKTAAGTIANLKKKCPALDGVPLVAQPCEFLTLCRVCGPAEEEIKAAVTWMTANSKRSTLSKHCDDFADSTHK